MIDLKELIKAGVYFGHRTSVWSPKMKPYIWGKRGDIYLIDVSKTAQQLEKAAKFLEGVSSEGKSILWIGTKKAAGSVVKEVADGLGASSVTHRWIGGTITNRDEVKKSVSKFLHYTDIVEKSGKHHYTKKEINTIGKAADRLKKNIGGIVDLKLPIGAVVIVDPMKEQSAFREALLEKIPVVALVDTNCDPSLIDFVIPCNDDSPRSIKIILEFLAAAVEKGKEKKSAAKEEAKKTAPVKKESSEKAEKKAEPKKVEKVATKEETKKSAPVKKESSEKAEKKAEPKKVEKVATKEETKKSAPVKKESSEKAEKKETTDSKSVKPAKK